jgi:transcriptional regulator with XRE-family HTH domain
MGHSLLKNLSYSAYKRGKPPHFHRFEGAEMPGVDLVSNLRAALERRRITFKAAARMCGRSPDTIQRIFQGRTAKLDAQDIVAMAAAVAEERSDPAERDRFLFEVFEIGSKPASQDMEFDRRIVRLERLALPQPTCLWFDESGIATRHARTDLAALAYTILDMKPGREDIVAFACRNLGYVGMSLDAVGTLRLHYAPDAATRQALTAAREWLCEHSNGVKRVLRNRAANSEAGEMPESETTSDAIAALGRRILAATPLPPGEWLVERRSIEETPDPLRDTLRLAHAGSSPMTGLAAANKLRAAHIYSVIDGEAVSLQMSATHNLPTSRYVGRRVLDRPTDRDYAALVDRHLTESLRENSATLYKLSLRIGGNRRNYWRLALPDRDSGIVVSAPWEPPENQT